MIYYAFWNKVAIRGVDECWEWQGWRDSHGYGDFYDPETGEHERAHRLAFMLTDAELTPGAHVLHSCDNPPCCNPSHLHSGDPALNSREKIERGRSNRGERHGHAKLSDAIVREIRQVYAAGGISQRAIAARYGVSQSQISFVLSGRTWSHVA